MRHTPTMGKKIRRLKNVRIHHEGTDILRNALIILIAIAALLWYGIESTKIPFWCFVIVAGIAYCMAVNFFQCPKRVFPEATTGGVVVAPADGKIVVIEEVNEDDYFHDKRLMISIFMSLTNVHANWFPVDGTVKKVSHKDGNYHCAWLPKASEENEHADVVIETPEGAEVMCRQVAGALARRIVTYAKAGEDCYIDEHLGFIKFGSRVDIFIPADAQVCVEMGQSTVGDRTVIARLSTTAASGSAVDEG